MVPARPRAIFGQSLTVWAKTSADINTAHIIWTIVENVFGQSIIQSFNLAGPSTNK